MPPNRPSPAAVPAGSVRRNADVEQWVEALPALRRELFDDWQLCADGAELCGSCARVYPVRTDDGRRAVLKIGWPHWEAEHEHMALRHWAGDGAVRLLRADPRRWALLLERLHPRDLGTVDVLDACAVVAGLYDRLHVPAPARLVRLSALAARWADQLAALPADAAVPHRYVEQAAALCRDFATDPATDGRLIHSDLHYFNVLAADREPWLVIDPKPLSGDPHHEVAPLLWNRWEEVVGAHDVRAAVRARLHTVVDRAGLDEDRARGWVIVRGMVNAMEVVQDGDATSAAGADWLTGCVAVVKAVQD